MSAVTPNEEIWQRHFQSRLEGLRNDRRSFWEHWGELAEVFMPRRYMWVVEANKTRRGSAINRTIIDETGILAARVLASGMMSGMTSPTRPWYRLTLANLEQTDFGPTKDWLAEVQRRMTRVFGESNFYQGLATLYNDIGVFGSAAMIIYEDDDDVIRVYNPCLGEFFFGLNSRLDVDTLYREFTLTTKQVVDQFGYDNVPEYIQVLYQLGGASWEVEQIIQHGIEPNLPMWNLDGTMLPAMVAKKFKYREVYWLQGQQQERAFLKSAGFNEKPFIGARWDLASNDAYGRSPGMDAMPATRQLQIQQRRKAEAIDKLVRPPVNASVNMKNEAVSTLPGSVNYVSDLSTAGMKPVYQIDPRVQELVADIKDTQARVNEIFYASLFTMISQLDTVRTATEIDARREEKLIQLGPVIERLENNLDEIIERVFAIMLRRGLLPKPPAQLAGAKLEVEYISMLAEAQRAAASAAIERILQVVGGMIATFPDAGDNLDTDELIRTYADIIAVPPQLIRPLQALMMIRQQKQQAAEEAQRQQQTLAAVQGANTLSKTEVGGGINALQAAMGGGTPGTSVQQ